MPLLQVFSDLLSHPVFALYRRPGGSWQHNFGGDYDGCTLGCGSFEASLWPGEKADTIAVCRQSTPREQYFADVRAITAALRRRGGKTVLSRRICGTFKHFDLEAIAEKYFADFADMFCFLFHHPATGYWMGASPELLLDWQSTAYRTRALAGTRPVEKSGDWDDKNLQEHAIVVDDICNRINQLEMATSCSALSELSYGAVAHLCTEIAIATPCPTDPQTIIAAIHPTPALAGYPRADALADIERYETSPRYFYGGSLCVPGLCYAALRCVNFDAEHWCVYTGSGITADSDAALEWDETEAKAAPLTNLLKKF